jgi:hypothetical protein
MKSLLSLTAAGAVLLAICLAPMPSAAQARGAQARIAKTKVDLNAPAPRLSNGKPDFRGTWARPYTPDITKTFTNADGTSNKGEPVLPFTEWGKKQWDSYNPTKNGDYAGNCMPFGWIRSFSPHPMQIIQNDEHIAFLFEQSTMFAVVPTDGRPHRDGYPPTWFGDSVGKWDGDTLTIEAVNFNGWAKLDTSGHPFSKDAKLTMTFKRPDLGHILFTWVLDDPKTYTRPIRNERVFVITPDVEVMEYSCMEGNIDNLLSGVITPWHPPEDQE